ncbi:MAG TPA: hypothetical protein VIM06_12105 [Rhodanobacter sp.]
MAFPQACAAGRHINLNAGIPVNFIRFMRGLHGVITFAESDGVPFESDGMSLFFSVDLRRLQRK